MMNSTLKKTVLLPAFGAAVLLFSSCEAISNAAFRMGTALLAAKASEHDAELGNDVRSLLGDLQRDLLPGVTDKDASPGIAIAEEPETDELDEEPLAEADELDEEPEYDELEYDEPEENKAPERAVREPVTLGSLLGRAGGPVRK